VRGGLGRPPSGPGQDRRRRPVAAKVVHARPQLSRDPLGGRRVLLPRASLAIITLASACAFAPNHIAEWRQVYPGRFLAFSTEIDLQRETALSVELPALPTTWLSLTVYLPLEAPLTLGLGENVLRVPGADAELSVSVEKSDGSVPFTLSGTFGYWPLGGELGQPQLNWQENIRLGPLTEPLKVRFGVVGPSKFPVQARFAVEAVEHILSARPPHKRLQLTAAVRGVRRPWPAAAGLAAGPASGVRSVLGWFTPGRS
jgi:hypothetical protein